MIGSDVRDLRPDVHRQATQLEQRLRRDALRDKDNFVERHTELRRFFPGPRVWVRRLRRDVGVHADADVGRLLEAPRHREQGVELARGFDVDEPDARADRFLELGRGLADPRKHDAVGIESGGEHAAQLPHRDDVGARAELFQHAEHAEVAVRLDRVADAVADALQCVVQGVVLRANQVGAVDVGGGPDAIRDRLKQSWIDA
jgi:hypothetical protein